VAGKSSRDGKTEKPTAKRRRDARREGNLPRSQETNSMLAVSAALVAFTVTTPSAMKVTARMLRDWLRTADPNIGFRRDPPVHSVTQLVTAWCPPVLAAAGAGIIATLAQGGLVLLPKTGRPSLKQLSWKRGLSQLSPRQSSGDRNDRAGHQRDHDPRHRRCRDRGRDRSDRDPPSVA